VIRRPRRPLSEDEHRLWVEVARSVVPLSGRAPLPPEEAPPAPPAPETSRPAKPAARLRAAEAPRPAAVPPLAPMERRMVRALARGQTRAEATLDLHGMTQTSAHARLLAFLRGAQASGHGVVLVVTGRGREGDEARGVLRRMVPHWLALAELRSVVLGFQEAGTRQGGAGALYVRLRRPR
jgi:DNA-nicking Smr family endonuclease